MDKDIYKGFILQHIKNHRFATREDIDKLLLDNLPEYLTEKQRKKRIHNLMQEMSGISIINSGSKAKPKWILL